MLNLNAREGLAIKELWDVMQLAGETSKGKVKALENAQCITN